MGPTPAIPSHKLITVLLVDEDITFVKVAQHHLQNFQGREFKLIWKDRVEDALNEVKTNKNIDIILTDYNLPGANGLEFCLQLNALNSEIPIVFATVTRDFRLAVDAMKLGVEDFLVKEDISELLLPKTMINSLEKARTRKQIQAVEKRMLIAEKRAEAIRELVVTVCHEFNNPLAAIKISADLLSRQFTRDEKAMLEKFEQNFSKIEREIRRLRDINFERINPAEIQAKNENASG
ncbi:MAG: response regulator [Ignavibacteriales bacterium]|nr:response regulator [Ignavibacteriales bacterium]